jgi:hypothetical protein
MGLKSIQCSKVPRKVYICFFLWKTIYMKILACGMCKSSGE